MAAQELKDALETLMDSHNVYHVLTALADVCEEKAQYVGEGGSHGEPSAYLENRWKKVARRIRMAENLAAGL